jgi:uncharacterized protein (DUF58 family)
VSQISDLAEILSEVRKIELLTRGIVRSAVGGEYHSVFKGQGIDFDEFREYQPGDEVRRIDWNVTARMGGLPFIKKFVEEREMTVFLVVDTSPSMDYGSSAETKRKLAARLAGLFALSAVSNQDKVGLVTFSDGIEGWFPVGKGHRHALRLIREVLASEAKGTGSNPSLALERLTNQLTKRALVILISDFVSVEYEKALSICAVRHDVVAIQISDAHEVTLPDIGKIYLQDAETGRLRSFNTSKSSVREQHARNRQAWQRGLDEQFRKLSIDKIEVTSGADWKPAVHSFFKKRAARR